MSRFGLISSGSGYRLITGVAGQHRWFELRLRPNVS
jgi:hypothetical protein